MSFIKNILLFSNDSQNIIVSWHSGIIQMLNLKGKVEWEINTLPEKGYLFEISPNEEFLIAWPIYHSDHKRVYYFALNGN